MDDPLIQPPADSGHSAASEPEYFSVSPLKLIIMYICTLGIYKIYWFYRQWSCVKRHERSEIAPIWRAVFSLIFAYSLFERIRASGRRCNTESSFVSGLLVFGLWILAICARLPAPFWIVTFFSVVLLVPVQFVIDDINDVVNPQHDPNQTFTKSDIVVMVIGGSLLLLAVIGAFLLPRA